jgi:indole-3-acetate monooxygenase
MESIAPGAGELLESARRLRPLIEGDAAQIERERRISPAVVAALRGAGLYRMMVPRSLGGSELTLRDFSLVMEEIARGDGSTAWCLGQNSGICRVAGYLPRAGAVEVFGSPDMVLSWGNGPGTARRVEGGYVLNFRASFSSGMHHATWLGCQDCDVYDAEGRLVLNSQGERFRGICFFPRDTVEVTDVWQVSGLRGTGSDSYSVTDLFIPEHRFALEEPQEPGTLYLFNTTNIFAVGFASVALGLARASLDALLDVTDVKRPRGARSVLRDLSRIQGGLGQAEGTYRSARALLHRTAEDAWNDVCDTRELSLETRINLRLATTFAMQRSAEVVDFAYRAAGVNAIFENNAFERRFRDMHAVTQHIQARDDHLEKVGQFLMGLDPDRGWL